MTPLFEREGFLICFEALEEEMPSHTHFIEECGYTAKQFRAIETFPFFIAKVSAWLDGQELGTAYLGACCYKTTNEFYTTYRDEYFADMVEEALGEAKGVGGSMNNLYMFEALAPERQACKFSIRANTEDAARTEARHWVIDRCDCSLNWLIELVETKETQPEYTL